MTSNAEQQAGANSAPRSIQACLECRRSKLKCDGMLRVDLACTRCQKRGKKCTWSVHLPLALPSDSNNGHDATTGTTTSPVIDPREDKKSAENGLARTSPHSNHAASAAATRNTTAASSAVQSPRTYGTQSTRKRDWDAGAEATTSSSSNAERPSHSRHAVSWSRRRVHSRSRSPPSQLNSGMVSRDRSRSPGGSGPSTNPAPLVHMREVALLSHDPTGTSGTNTPPRQAYEALMTASVTPDSTISGVSPGDAALADVQAIQGQYGWTRDRLRGIGSQRRRFYENAIAPEPDSLRGLDPLEMGLIDEEDAMRLFALYYTSINTQHCLLDPEQDTWSVVRARSRALFIIIAGCAASIDPHPRSRNRLATLIRSMEETVTLLLLSNAKSPDVVKTLLLAYLFTQKPDQVAYDRCWLLVDAASRAAAELGLGLRLRTPQASVVDTDTYANRNAERAWIFSVVMQRSLSTSTGLWPISKLDVKWDKLEAWCEVKSALPGDVQMVAYMFLRRLEYHTRSQFEKIDADKFLTLESIRAGFNALWSSWRSRWVDHPRLVDEDFSRSFLLTVGQHIQLLLNVTTLKLAEGSRRRRRDVSRDIPADLELFCVHLATELCTDFITNFRGRGHELCRNLVSMVTWSAMALLQMDVEKGRMIALQVALMLAGDGNDQQHRNNLSSFYGRCLLSLVNDLAVAGSTGGARKGRRQQQLQQFNHHAHALKNTPGSALDLKVHANGALANGMSPHGVGSIGLGGGVGYATDSGSAGAGSAARVTSPTQQTTPSEGRPDWHTDGGSSTGTGGGSNNMHNQISAEKMLSSMAAPLSADPFNETWLNSFLDNLVPVSWPLTSGLGSGEEEGRAAPPPPPPPTFHQSPSYQRHMPSSSSATFPPTPTGLPLYQ